MGVFQTLLGEPVVSPESSKCSRCASGSFQSGWGGSFDSTPELPGPLSLGPGRSGPGSPNRTRCDELRAEYEAARAWFDESSLRYIEIAEEHRQLVEYRNSPPGTRPPPLSQHPCAAIQRQNDQIRPPRHLSDAWRQWYSEQIQIATDCMSYVMGGAPGAGSNLPQQRENFQSALDVAIREARDRQAVQYQVRERARLRALEASLRYRRACPVSPTDMGPDLSGWIDSSDPQYWSPT